MIRRRGLMGFRNIVTCRQQGFINYIQPMYREPELKYTVGDCYPFMSAGNYFVTEI